MNAFIRLLYSLLIAASIVAFIGVTTYSFYQPPKAPEYSAYDYGSDTSFDQPQRSSYDQAVEEQDDKQKDYYRNVTIILVPLTILTVAAGIYVFSRNGVIGEGLALGGVATGFYAIVTASLADARVLRFVAVTLLLAAVLVTAYRRFTVKGPSRPIPPL